MESHIFGTFSTDALKLLHERVSDLGVQHRARLLPPDPQPGEPVTLLVTSGPDSAVRELVARYSVDGRAPTMQSPTVRFEPTRRRWSTPAWGYVTEWRATLPPQPEGTFVHYRVAARVADGWHDADWPLPKVAVEEALVHGMARQPDLRPAAGSDFAYSVDRFEPPTWAREALIYQLFLDRFARPDGAPWPGGLPLDAIHGGTLRGATERLEHVASLGASCIWLSPLFPSPTHHGYDATDYYAVEPRLGTKEELRELVDRAHALGMRVLLDFVCNHLSNDHAAFRSALERPHAAERDWFWLDPSHGPHGYRAFFGVASMPELNTDHPAVREHLIGAAEMWLRDFDVDGFRLDYAHGPSHAFWSHFWRAVKRVKPDAWCFGEIVDTPETQLGYVGRLDGVLDFHLGDGLRAWVRGERDCHWLDAFLRDHDAFFPLHERFSRPAFLDNHDMDRLLYLVGGDEARLRQAALLLYTLPNPPILYYGTEVALPQRQGTDSGGGLEVSREPMDWARVAAGGETLRAFQRLGALRRYCPAMRPAWREPLLVEVDHYLARQGRGESTLLVALNRSPRAGTIRHEALRGPFVELLGEARMTLDGALTLPPHGSALLAVPG